MQNKLRWKEILIPEDQEMSRVFLEEANCLPQGFSTWVQKRKNEFIAGRLCARDAIHALTNQIYIPRINEEDRSPKWPNGISGSISHSGKLACAVVGPDDFLIGVDIEKVSITESKKKALNKLVISKEEKKFLQNFSSSHIAEEIIPLLVFSAKETLYKALYPKVKKYFSFSAAQLVEVKNENSSMILQLQHDLNPFKRGEEFLIYYSIDSQYVMTLLVGVYSEE